MRIKLFHMTILFGHKGGHIFLNRVKGIQFFSSVLPQNHSNFLHNSKETHWGNLSTKEDSVREIIRSWIVKPIFWDQGGEHSFHQFFPKTTQTSCTTQRKHIGETYQPGATMWGSKFDRDSRFGENPIFSRGHQFFSSVLPQNHSNFLHNPKETHWGNLSTGGRGCYVRNRPWFKIRWPSWNQGGGGIQNWAKILSEVNFVLQKGVQWFLYLALCRGCRAKAVLEPGALGCVCDLVSGASVFGSIIYEIFKKGCGVEYQPLQFSGLLTLERVDVDPTSANKGSKKKDPSINLHIFNKGTIKD